MKEPDPTGSGHTLKMWLKGEAFWPLVMDTSDRDERSPNPF